MCGAAASSYGWIDPGTMNNVILTNLTPSTMYHYSYGDPVSDVLSKKDFTVNLLYVLVEALNWTTTATMSMPVRNALQASMTVLVTTFMP